MIDKATWPMAKSKVQRGKARKVYYRFINMKGKRIVIGEERLVVFGDAGKLNDPLPKGIQSGNPLEFGCFSVRPKMKCWPGT
jgi:hypothetical protein